MIGTNEKKTLALYSGIALLFIYPLIQAGIFYRDDLDRAITGQYGWRGLGRPVADIIMKILSASGHYNLDLFPYTMIASCLCLGAASLLLMKHLSRMEIRYATFVSGLLIFNPYILQNIAYRYDSLGMALAFLLAVLAYTYSNKNKFHETLVKLVSGIIALTLYQPCANIFIGLLAVDVLILGVKSNTTAKETFKLIARKTAEFILFYFIYMLLFSVKNNSRAALITPNTEGLHHLSSTVKGLYELVSSYFHGPVYLYFLIPALIAISFSIFRLSQNKNTLLSFITLAFISFFIFSVSLMGPTIFLEEAPIFPRTLVSFSVLLILIAILVVESCPKLKFIALAPVITIFAFSAQLSSALESQRNYENLVFSMAAKDMLNYESVKSVSTVGQVNINERARLLIENKPLIGYFLSPAAEFMASFQLIDKGVLQTSHGYGEEQGNNTTLKNIINEKIKPVVANNEYSIYIQDNLAIIKLGSGSLN